jgi:hypothetical protein
MQKNITTPQAWWAVKTLMLMKAQRMPRMTAGERARKGMESIRESNWGNERNWEDERNWRDECPESMRA